MASMSLAFQMRTSSSPPSSTVHPLGHNEILMSLNGYPDDVVGNLASRRVRPASGDPGPIGTRSVPSGPPSAFNRWRLARRPSR